MKIRVISQIWEGAKIVETEAKVWRELRSELDDQLDVDLDNMKVIARYNVNGEKSKMVLELEDTILPTEDFVIFLTPSKVKSGLGK